MKEEFVTYEIAVKLKKKGFPQIKKGTLAMYNEEGEWYSLSETLDDYYYSFEDFDDKDCVCPTISQVLKWLRKGKSLHIEIVSSAYGYIYIVSDTPDRGGTDRVNIPYKGKNDGGAWDDYNECVFDAIEYVIDNLI